MASKKEKQCACKGIRTCLLCEDNHDRSSTISEKKVCPPKRLFYCGHCETCYPGQEWENCDQHAHMEKEGILLPGITIIPEFVNEEEERELERTINKTPWRDSQSGRRKQDYGPKVNFKKKKIQCSVFTGLPSFSQYLVERMQQHKILTDFIPVELCNLEYDPDRGAAIDPHFDDFWLWGERLVTLNLLSDTFYTMTLPDQPDVECMVRLKRRTLVVIAGEARTKFMHAIKRDDITSKRLGITLRELSKEFEKGGEREEIGQKVIETALQYNGLAVGSVDRTTSNDGKRPDVDNHHRDMDTGDVGSNRNTQTNLAGTTPGPVNQLTHQQRMEEDGFQQVTRKKSAKRARQNAVEFSKMVGRTLSASSLSVSEVLAKVQSCLDELIADGYAQTFCGIALPTRSTIQRIVSYGIGSFSSCYKARYQLAILLFMKNTLGLECLVYDPVWSDVELKCLKELAMIVLTKDERGCRCVRVPTLFYLPHCPRHLTNNLLWTNWTAGTLPLLHIVANNLLETESLPKHIIEEDSSYILRILPYTSSVDIPNTFCSMEVFNNLAINTFPSESVSHAPLALWEDVAPPVYTDQTDIDLNIILPVRD